MAKIMYAIAIAFACVWSILRLSNAWAPIRSHPYISERLYVLSQHTPRATRLEQDSRDSHFDSIFQDGRVNRALAECLWDWEQERRMTQHLPKVEYSVRSGLRLVEDLVRQITSERRGQRSSYNELIQEGLWALLDAMNQYRQHADSDLFETYARTKIQRRLGAVVESQGRPLRLPRAVAHVVRQAQTLLEQSSSEYGKALSAKEIAVSLKIPLARLRDYMRLARGQALSMETTVEEYSPMLKNSGPSYKDQEEWELRHGLVLDDGHIVHRDILAGEFLDEMLEFEGEDEAWLLQAQLSGPLQDIIPDRETVVATDAEILQEMIMHDMTDFLSSTLDIVENRIVRLAFGLDLGNPLSLNRVATEMNLDANVVADALKVGLNKLRAAYRIRYAAAFDDLSDEDAVDSV